MDINQTLEQIIRFYDSGGNPQQVMQQMFQQNPQMNQMQTQIQNMAQGKTPMEFIMQIANQNGVNEKNLQWIKKMLSKK